MTEDLYQKRMTFLAETLQKYLNTEPKLSLELLCVVLCEQVEDLESLIVAYRKEKKKSR